ncbi:MAG: DNA polymerase III subunit beta [Alphaproteobacteria bacterium]|nr:DNA polymerase III subunit beta [Alphaproteobacteria bacterium]
MDLYIERDELIRGLARVQGIVERRPTTQALSHVLLQARDGGLVMTATDTALALVAEYTARVEEPGELSVDAAHFFQIARSLPEPTVHLQSQPGNRLAIRCGAAEFTVVGMAADEFPPLPTRDDRAALTISGGELRRLIEETQFSVSADDNRYGLNGAHIEEVHGDDGSTRIRVVTTDGSRLSWSEAPFAGDLGMGRRMLVPRKALGEIRKLCDADGEEWKIAFGERSATFSTAALTLMVRLIDGEFPNYRQVLPQASRRSVRVQREAFAAALKRVAIVASDRNHSVRFAFEPDQLVLTADNVDLGNARETVPAELDGEPLFTGFNVRYFQDVLSATRSDQLELQLNDVLDPCIVRLPDRDDAVFVVMPMRLD